MHDRGKSDRLVVPEKLPNKLGRPGAEVVEERGLPKGNTAGETLPDAAPGWGCQAIWTVCAEWRERIGMCGSPRSCIT
jgi:hypothetical protein